MPKGDLRKWSEAWQRASVRMKAERLSALRQSDYADKLHLLDDAIDWSIRNSELRLTSGLVEQQAKFSRLRKKQ